MIGNKKLFFFGSAELLVQIIPVLLMPIYLKIFNLDGYGSMNLLIAYMSLLIPITGLCFNQIAVRSIHANDNIELSILLSLIISILNGFILIALIYFFGTFLSTYLDFKIILYAAILGIFGSIYLLLKDIAIHTGNQIIYSIMLLAQIVITHSIIFLTFFLFDFEYQWQYRFYAELISYIICTYFFILFWYKKLNLSYSGFNAQKVNTFVINNINIALGAIPRTLLKWYRVVVDRQYLVIYVGMFAVGEFTVATQIATMLSFPFMIISTFFSPIIVKNLRKHNYQSFVKFVTISFILILSILFLWSLVSKYFLEIYIGKGLVHLSDTIMILMLSLFLMLISSSSLSFFTQSGLSSKRYDFTLFIFILAPIGVMFFKPMDITNVAYINLLVSTIYFIYCLVESIRLYKNSAYFIDKANRI